LSSPPSLVTIGEAMCVFATSAAGPLRNGSSAVVGIADAESNVAIAASRLGVSCAWVGRVGDDPMGQLILRELRAEGVDLRAVTPDPGAATGVMLKERRTTALTQVTYCRNGSAGSRLTTDDVPQQLIEEASVLHVSGVTLGISESARLAAQQAIRWAQAAKVVVSFDVNYRRALWPPETAYGVLAETCSSADVVFASAEEALALANQLGGYCVSVEGDWEGLPTLDELDETRQQLDPVLRQHAPAAPEEN
jgi:2-dehydro-3-deoxygluconokinase